VPGVFSQGETVQELERNIRDAYQLMLAEIEEAPSRRARTREILVDT
jgi:predicted RNase H-like HicB family nuclease